MTWIEKLREVLPNSVYVQNAVKTIITLCPYKFFGCAAPNYDKHCGSDCRRCWNSEVKE